MDNMASTFDSSMKDCGRQQLSVFLCVLFTSYALHDRQTCIGTAKA